MALRGRTRSVQVYRVKGVGSQESAVTMESVIRKPATGS
jgi:hypothetical protein